MDGTIRIRTAAWFATAIVLAVVSTLLVTQAWSAGAAPGDEDSTFVPTAGCRLVDTRPAPFTVGLRSAPLGAGDVFEVTVHGANGDCTGALAIPTDAVAVALNVTAVNATATSNIRVYPANLTEVPTLSNLNVTAGAPPTPNKVDVQLSPDGKIRVFNFRGSVNIFIDVVGFYTKTSLQELTERLVTAESAIATLQADTAALEATQPFAVTNRDDVQILTNEREVIVSVTLTAPTAGHVVVNSSTESFVTAANTGAECFITMGTDADNDYAQRWRSALDIGVGQLGGTRMFEIAADATETYDFTCRQFGTLPNGSGVENSVLTAIFTPAP